MQKKISPQDWEALSAYLDGQQKPRERARLEARLHEETELKAALVSLQRTREVLQIAPHLRAPRNFMLKPEMVRQPTRFDARFYAGFRIASAIASLLFVIVVLGDLTGIGTRLSFPMESAAPQPMEFASQEDAAAPNLEMMEAPAAEEPALALEASAAEMPASKEMAVEESPAESFALELPASETEAETPMESARTELAPASEPSAEEGGEPYPGAALDETQGSSLGQEELAAAAEASIVDETTSGEGEIAAVESQEELLSEVPVSNEYPTPEVFENREAKPRSQWSVFRFIEVILGLFVVILVPVTIYLRRQVHG